MKKIILLVSVVLFGCVGYAQAQTSEKKLSRQERKEAKRAMEQALFEEKSHRKQKLYPGSGSGYL